jgi:hypothetical protein
MTSNGTTTAPTLRVLARQEIRQYLNAKLYWFGAALLATVTVASFVGSSGNDRGDHQTSSTLDMIAPAALLGILGLIIMAGLTRRSDRAAGAAGTLAVPERTRTAALVAATVVPVATALVWFAAAVVAYLVNPPTPDTVPIPPFGDGDVFTVMFALGVVPALSGPILGLLIARWLPRRGVTPLAVVLVVLVTIVMQGNFEATWHWRVVWPWTYWYGPVGWDTGEGHWAALPGSPQLWIAYLLALCVLGVLVAVYHDPESDRSRLRVLIAATAVAAVVAVVLTMVFGLPEATWNPVTGPVS